MAETKKPHIVCIPYPTQGHITPMLILAKLLHKKGFQITFVHTHFNYNRLLKSQGPQSLSGSPTFRFETIPDGLPPSANTDATQNVIELCLSTAKNCSIPLRNLVNKLNNSCDVPPVSCIVSDGIMAFSLEISEEVGIPNVFFWTVSAFSLMCYLHYSPTRELAFAVHTDTANDMRNVHLDSIIDWIPGIGSIRIRDTPSAIWHADWPDSFEQYCIQTISTTYKASAVILNTFDELEPVVLPALSSLLNRVYTIGPIHNLPGHEDDHTKSLRSNLWEADLGCIQWLDTKPSGSVVYVNFGSITVMSPQHLVEFAWGLANSMQNFLWIIRPDLVMGNGAVLPPEFEMEVSHRGLLVSWCDQEQVLNHTSVGGFLTHCGWNSTLESLSAGVPMICWPFFGDQVTNCHCICKLWGVGLEIDDDVKREGVERVVKELMNVEEKGKEINKRVVEWKNKAKNAASPLEGSSYLNLDKLVDEVILSSMKKW